MSANFWSLMGGRGASRHYPVPEGHPTIAQRFNVGELAGKHNLVPKGRLRALRAPTLGKSIVVGETPPFHMKLVTCGSEPSAVPSGLMVLRALVPNVETLGYCQESLRDEDEILVALPVLGRSKPRLCQRDPIFQGFFPLLRRGVRGHCTLPASFSCARAEESQRDSATKPRVARNELPWVSVPTAHLNSEGVAPICNAITRRVWPRSPKTAQPH